MSKKNNDLYKITVVGLIALLAINFGGDYVFRGGQIELNELQTELNEDMSKAWTMQAEWNKTQSTINKLVAEVLVELDKDVRSNMRVVDQLIGIILENEYV